MFLPNSVSRKRAAAFRMLVLKAPARPGNADFMQALVQQLHVPAADARDTMREVLAARPVCPLGGEYKLASGNSAWISTAWTQQYIGYENRVPADFKSPFLQWFHGLDLEFSINATTLTTHIELELTPANAGAPAKIGTQN